MKKLLLLFASILVVASMAHAQVLVQENFSFSGNLTANGWSAHSGTGTNALATTTGLSYANYMSSGIGNAAFVSALGGEDANIALSDSVYTDGNSVYTAFLVNVTDVSANKTGDYFFHLGNRVNATTFTSFAARVFAKIENDKVYFGISNLSTAGSMIYSATEYAKNTTYLLIMKYTINTGGVDTLKLWVKDTGIPDNEIAAGAPDAIADASTQLGQDIIDALALRQGSNTTSVGLIVDGIRVGKSWSNAATFNPYDDPEKLIVKNTETGVTVDGKLDEADWNGAPSLLLGNGAHLKKQGGDLTGTGGFDIKGTFDVNSVTYHVPNTDSSWLRVKFLRKGTDLFIGLQSNDKSICKFDWEGDGLFLKIKNSVGEDKEYKLYWQNIEANKDTIRYEEQVLNSGNGAGFLMTGSTVNDTLDVDNGYSAELRIKLGSLGYTGAVGSVQLSMAMFDPDGFQHPMNSWDSARGSYYKSWWGSEWGGTYRTLEFTPEIVKYDDPAKLVVKNADGTVTVDGKLDEADWNGAPSLLLGNGAHLMKQGGDLTGTGGFDIKGTFDVNSVTYHVPNTDSSWLRVKFLRKGTDLFIGLQSNDKSICKFDWEGDGVFLKIKNSVGEDKEYKLYWQNIEANKDTIRYEEQVLNSGSGAGFLMTGSTVNDTLDVDNGYSAELRIKLGSLGYTSAVGSVQLSMAMFDPDGFQHPMNSWDSARGSYYKSWWGSEWGGTYRTLEFMTPYDNPDTIVANIAASVMTLDGKLDESEWASANTLIFGPSNAPKTGNEKTVTGSVDVKKNFDVGGVFYQLPYKDTSYTKVKFLAKGNDLYIGIQSPDKSICKFDWEGDGLFMKIKNSVGDDKEFKLYWQNIDANKDTIRYEEQVLNSGAGAGFLVAGSTVNDTTNVDNGYFAELKIKLNSLGFSPTSNKVDLTVSMAIFDPDGFQHPMAPWDSARGSYFKSWWGSEWGGVYKTIAFPKTTGVGDAGEMPLTFALNQNYPNPFNPSTTIRYSIPVATPVVLKIYNMIGQEVSTLVNSEHKPGNYDVKFDAGRFATGIYIYRIQAGSFVETKKMMLIK